VGNTNNLPRIKTVPAIGGIVTATVFGSLPQVQLLVPPKQKLKHRGKRKMEKQEIFLSL
jgi:hypothetical protein